MVVARLAGAGDQKLEVIDEFPYFSFIISDLHPHVMALPFALLALALALATLATALSDNGLVSPFRSRQFLAIPVYLWRAWILELVGFPHVYRAGDPGVCD